MSEKNNTFLAFLKKNAIYLILTLCVLAIGLSVTLVLINKNKASLESGTQTINENPSGDSTVITTPDDPSEPVATVITFIMPMANSSVFEEYSNDVQFNSTLNRFCAHEFALFKADEGTDVFACYDGTVESVEKSLLNGVTITIDHGNGLKTLYNSVSEDVLVEKGQTVKQGEIIAKVSNTNRQENYAGSHLHFETVENGNKIDPSKYLMFEEK